MIKNCTLDFLLQNWPKTNHTAVRLYWKWPNFLYCPTLEIIFIHCNKFLFEIVFFSLLCTHCSAFHYIAPFNLSKVQTLTLYHGYGLLILPWALLNLQYSATWYVQCPCKNVIIYTENLHLWYDDALFQLTIDIIV